MQFRINKNELKTALANVSKAVATKAEIKSLECVLFQLKQNELKLTGYDLTQGITTIINAESMDSGEFLIQPKLLSGIINKMPSGDIDFLVENSNMTIASGKTQFTLQVQNSNEYPNIPTFENSNPIEISQETLKSMINQTVFATATNSTRPIFTGELFEISNNELNVVAIDGYRLAVRTEELNADDINIVIPANALNKVAALLDEKSKANCQIYIDDKHVTFKINDYIVFSRLLEGQFHNYRASIPKSNVTEVTINCNELIDCLERCLLLINDRIKSPVKCIFKDGQVSLSLNTQLGKINDIVECEVIGPQIEIGFNVKYFLDALKATNDENVKLLMNGSTSPMTVKGDNYTFLVLPVRLKND
jgi:DNA polymerase-3 subunit beta